MFDIKNGTIYLEKYKINIEPSFTHEKFCSSELFKKATPFVKNPPYNSYRLEEGINFLGEKFTIVLFYHNDRLSRMNLSFYVPNKSVSWDDWCEEKELETKNRQDNLLKQNFGDPPYEYQWGSLESVYDKRSGSSHLIISYR
jgi:hypothetical protein